jgi:3-oxoacyl-(acyl-carrier-protein) synthase
MNEVVITGVGVLSPIGNSPDEVRASLLQSRSGISAFESADLSRAFPVARVPGSFEENFPRLERPFLDRTTQLALLAAGQAAQASGIVNFSSFEDRAGIFHGTVRGGGATEWEGLRHFYAGRKTAKPYVIMGCMANAAASLISIKHQVRGVTACHTSACASSGSAIADACRYLRAGDLDIALAGGAEAPLASPFLSAWDGLRALAEVDPTDASRSCKPFSSQRSGLVLGEGSVYFVLETRQHANARGAAILGVIEGWGVASDAHHIAAPHARGQVAAMRAALRCAGVGPEQIDYINAHATATRGGDPVEVGALIEVLGAAAESVPVSSTKGLHGHLLGAASAMELLVCLLALRDGFIPPTAHLHEAAPDCLGVRHVTSLLSGQGPRRALTLSAGFGGVNAALVLRAATA